MVHERLFADGARVEFDDFDHPEVVHTGVVINYLEADEDGTFKGGYHVAEYFVVPEEDLRPAKDEEKPS